MGWWHVVFAGLVSPEGNEVSFFPPSFLFTHGSEKGSSLITEVTLVGVNPSQTTAAELFSVCFIQTKCRELQRGLYGGEQSLEVD